MYLKPLNHVSRHEILFCSKSQHQADFDQNPNLLHMRDWNLMNLNWCKLKLDYWWRETLDHHEWVEELEMLRITLNLDWSTTWTPWCKTLTYKQSKQDIFFVFSKGLVMHKIHTQIVLDVMQMMQIKVGS